jgi:Uma2 family endonuclease
MSTTITLLDYYLHETWGPDREYVNGEILERNMGEKDHAAWQIALMAALREWRQPANIRIYPELRLQTTPTTLRIPDVMAIERNAPDEQIITHPPLLCVEILSPEDRFSRMEDKIAEYFRLGVRAVWVVEPRKQTAYQCEGAPFSQWRITSELTIPGTPVRIELAALIADLD